MDTSASVRVQTRRTTITSGPVIARQTTQAGLDGSALTTKHLYELARQDDVRAGEIVQRISRTLARAIQTVMMPYCMEKLVLGGGVTSAGKRVCDYDYPVDHLLLSPALLCTRLLAGSVKG